MRKSLNPEVKTYSGYQATLDSEPRLYDPTAAGSIACTAAAATCTRSTSTAASSATLSATVYTAKFCVPKARSARGSGRLRSRIRRPNGQPTQLPAAQQKHFDYDPAVNLIGRLGRDREKHRDQRQLLHYDATGRIIACQDSLHGQRETFAYDAAANLLDGPQAGAGLVVHNKLLTYQDKRYRYDAFGRMIEKRSAKRGVQRFTYDAESRLVEVRNDDGSVVRMTYDPLGRRIEKTEHGSDGYTLGETQFVWDGLRLLQEHKYSQTSLYVYCLLVEKSNHQLLPPQPLEIKIRSAHLA